MIYTCHVNLVTNPVLSGALESRHNHGLITIKFFLPWYIREIAHLEFNNMQSVNSFRLSRLIVIGCSVGFTF
jgi:hypothetical protein